MKLWLGCGIALGLIPGAMIALAQVQAQPGRATFGDVVVIGGQAADIALDERRGVLYIANFTAGRIDVLSLADNSIQTSIHVAAGPSSLALSADGRFLVATHFGNALPPASPTNALTVIDRDSGGRQTFLLGSPPVGVAFGADGMALVATTTEFLLLDPLTGRTDLVDTVAGVATNTIPAVPGTPPVQIVAATMASAGGGAGA
jgi:DNA-binding beta-propeller fold protein YncE